MDISRRTLLAAGSVGPVVADAAGKIATTSMDDGLIRETVTKLSWMLPQPSSSNTQIGFGMRKAALAKRLKQYAGQFQETFRTPPAREQLYAAGTVLANGLGSNSKSWQDPLPSAAFEELWVAAEARLRAIGSAIEPYDRTPGRVSPDVAAFYHPPEAGRVEVRIHDNGKLADLAWYLGGPSIALNAAIHRLWTELAFVRAPEVISPTPNGAPPTPVEAWRQLRRKSKLQRHEWAKARVARARQEREEAVLDEKLNTAWGSVTLDVASFAVNRWLFIRGIDNTGWAANNAKRKLAHELLRYDLLSRESQAPSPVSRPELAALAELLCLTCGGDWLSVPQRPRVDRLTFRAWVSAVSHCADRRSEHNLGGDLAPPPWQVEGEPLT